MSAPAAPGPRRLLNARLPAWLLGDAWPRAAGQVALACMRLDTGRVLSCEPMPPAPVQAVEGDWDLDGALVLPGFVDAHVHLDKVFTLARIPDVQPGLLGAIEATLRDLPNWTPQDVAERAARGIRWAWEQGTTRLRTHLNWSDLSVTPMAWPVLDELAVQWHGRVRIELVSLTRLDGFTQPADALALARRVRATGPHALLGGFVHSSNWNPASLRHLLVAARETDLDLDLHVDEELEPRACGLLEVARTLREIGYQGRAVCGHVCALAAQPLDEALATLDEVARAPITLVSLPITNLLLQDAVTGRTPRQRGITLVKEARERGIPLLFASDNVQDPFCRVGSFDPVECFSAAVLAAQLEDPFDQWSDTLCRADLLARGVPDARHAPPLRGQVADLVIFTQADATSWPSRAAARVVLRDGVAIHGQVPGAWTGHRVPSPDPVSAHAA